MNTLKCSTTPIPTTYLKKVCNNFVIKVQISFDDQRGHLLRIKVRTKYNNCTLPNALNVGVRTHFS